MLELVDEGQEANASRLDCILYTLLHEIRRGSDTTRRLVPPVRQFVRGTMGAPVSLADLADVVGLNKHYFVRAFKEETGTTPMRYVQKLRLETAHQLIWDTDLGLAEIARLVGICSGYHLSNLIREQFGLRPTDMRRQRAQESRTAAARRPSADG
jgi:transcriptional regulator GlxA family with amidase domain